MSNARFDTLPNGDSETLITVAKQYTEKDLEQCDDGSVCVSREAVEREEKKVKSILEKLDYSRIKICDNGTSKDNFTSCVCHAGLSLIPGKDWMEGCKDQDVKEIKFTVPWLQSYLKEKPIAALSFLKGDPRGQYCGVMSDEPGLGEDIVIAYLIAWNAAKQKKKRVEVFLWIYRNWKPLFRAINDARTPEEKKRMQYGWKTGEKHDWAQEKWVRSASHSDGITPEAIKAALTFFQEVYSCYLKYGRGEEDYAEDSESASDSEELSESDSEGNVGEEPPSKRVKRDNL